MARKNNRGRLTKILGGYGRTGRVLRTTFPAKIARLFSVMRGDKVRWEVVEPGHVITSPSIVVTLAQRGAVRSQKAAPPRTKPIAKQVRRKKLSEEYWEMPGAKMLDDIVPIEEQIPSVEEQIPSVEELIPPICDD